MSGDKFGMTVRLRHSFGRWRLEIGGRDEVAERDRDVTADDAMAWATLAGEKAVRAVRAVIREDADEAERRAKDERKRAKDEAQRLAGAVFDADVRARERREDADRLAPTHEQPPPFRVE